MTDESPRRRSDDCVSWRDMVEYVADQESKWHTVRAESLVLIGNTLEKLERSLDKHEDWHREVLEGAIQFLKNTATERENNQRTYRVGMWGIWVAIAALVVTTTVTLWLGRA